MKECLIVAVSTVLIEVVGDEVGEGRGPPSYSKFGVSDGLCYETAVLGDGSESG